jgi:CubicO group peptidase (beta-lactamase class C family)|tara:strand:- start:22181 stop:23941 length:1761 start_codon:yes stop_codon:yes gene_type:complete
MIGLKKTMLRFLFVGVITLLSSQNLSFSQTKSEQIGKLLNLYLESGQFNGSALVAEKGNVIFKKGIGMANMEWDIPNAPDTKHRLGSVSKQFTAMLIMQLVVDGKLELEATVSKYLPDYSKSNGELITLHHLLTHSSGIPNYTSFSNFFNETSRDPFSPSEFLKLFADSTLEFTPGSTFAYSNSGYFLLGAIIEKVTGKSYEQVLQDKILNPLKMTNTGYDHHLTILKKRASGYEKNGGAFENASYLDMSIPYAAGSLYSTTEDLYIWDQALYTEKLLPKKYKDIMFKSHIPAFGGHYAYGWSTSKMPIGNSEESIETIGHGGGINGFNTLITRITSDNSCIILLNNTGGAPLSEITIAITGILYGKAYDLPKKSLATALSKVITENGIESGIKFYEKNKNSKNYSVKEVDLNSLGYQLLRSEKIKESEAIFKLNTEAFPESFNVYDSYGESLMLQDKNELAIKNYKKSLELNPANQNGIDMLKKLGVDTDELVKEIIVPAEIMESYVGKYELMPGFILTVTKVGNQMKTQATGQAVADIFPKSNSVFYLKVVAAQITFNKNEKGEVVSLTLQQGGKEITGEKLPE